MEDLLDKADEKRRFFWWLFGGASFLLLVIYFLGYTPQDSKIRNSSVEMAVENSTELSKFNKNKFNVEIKKTTKISDSILVSAEKVNRQSRPKEKLGTNHNDRSKFSTKKEKNRKIQDFKNMHFKMNNSIEIANEELIGLKKLKLIQPKWNRVACLEYMKLDKVKSGIMKPIVENNNNNFVLGLLLTGELSSTAFGKGKKVSPKIGISASYRFRKKYEVGIGVILIVLGMRILNLVSSFFLIKNKIYEQSNFTIKLDDDFEYFFFLCSKYPIN